MVHHVGEQRLEIRSLRGGERARGRDDRLAVVAVAAGGGVERRIVPLAGGDLLGRPRPDLLELVECHGRSIQRVVQYGALAGAARYFAQVSQHLQRIIWKPAISCTVRSSSHLPGSTVTPIASSMDFALR